MADTKIGWNHNISVERINQERRCNVSIQAKMIGVQIKNIKDRASLVSRLRDRTHQHDHFPKKFGGLAFFENQTGSFGNLLLYNPRVPIRLAYGMRSLQKQLQLMETPKRILGIRLPQFFYQVIQDAKDRNVCKIVLGGDRDTTCYLSNMITNAIKLQNESAAQAVQESQKSEKETKKAQKEAPEAPEQIVNKQILPVKVDYNKRDRPHGTMLQLWFKDKPVILKVIGTQEDNGNQIGQGDFELTKEVTQSCNQGSVVTEKLKYKGNPAQNTQDRQENKRKHLYVYSQGPNYGKSTMARGMVEYYNAAIVANLNNFDGVRQNAQFLIFDQYTMGNCLLFDKLMRLSGGMASHFSAKTSSSPDGYVPRPDTQVIVLSNHHPFKVYADIWDSRRQRQFISPTRARFLTSRFRIVKLDEEETNVTAVMDASHFISHQENQPFLFSGENK